LNTVLASFRKLSTELY